MRLWIQQLKHTKRDLDKNNSIKNVVKKLWDNKKKICNVTVSNNEVIVSKKIGKLISYGEYYLMIVNHKEK